MITVNTPFRNLEPLTTYLAHLEGVTREPSKEGIAQLALADAALTSRAVLHPKTDLVHDEGMRVYWHEPRRISGEVQDLARVALLGPATSKSNLERATPEERRLRARGTLLMLGQKLPVSGAFIAQDIPEAYEKIRESLDTIGYPDKGFTNFGLGRISQRLFEEYGTTFTHPTWNPISAGEARRNINAAWRVIGRPYGPFTKLCVRVMTRP